MKKITLLYLLISAFPLFGQQYVPFPTNATWYQVDEVLIDPFGYRAYNYSYTLSGDTSIKMMTYRKLIKVERGVITYEGGLRENQQKELFFYEKSDSTERLIYKFGLSVGDSLKIRINTSDKPIKILSIDSIMVGDIFRKRYTMSTQTLGTKDYWIEGIGSTKGLFYTQKGGEFENTSTLFCFERNGIIEYRNTRAVSNCTTPTNELENAKIELYPNPTSHILNFNITGITKDLDLKIYDILGNLLLYKKSVNFDGIVSFTLDNISNGIYFYEFSTEKGKNTGKFFVQE